MIDAVRFNSPFTFNGFRRNRSQAENFIFSSSFHPFLPGYPKGCGMKIKFNGKPTELFRGRSKVSRNTVLLLSILVFAGTVRFIHLTHQLSSPLAHGEEIMTSSDFYCFSQWAKRIAAGDVLCRDTYHPYMDWMNPVADISVFEQWWGGKEIYHQAPLYAYLLALSYYISGTTVPILVLQIFFSLFFIYMVYYLGRRILDRQAGIIASLTAAMFAPAIVLDTIPLRASLVTMLTLLTVIVFLRISDKPSAGRGFITGAVLAAGYLLKPTWLILTAAGPVIVMISLYRNPNSKKWIWLPSLFAGFILCLTPLFIRNLIVGAPVAALSTRGPETVYQANNRYADPAMFTMPPAHVYAEDMEKAHGSVIKALIVSISSWSDEGGFVLWLKHEWRKFICIIQDFEHPNNINFYYYRKLTPFLKYFPTFGHIFGVSLIGLVFMFFTSRNRTAVLLFLLAILSIIMGLLLTFVLGRYRLPLAMLLTVPAGIGFSLVLKWTRQKKFLKSATTVLLAILLSWLSFTTAPSRATFAGDAMFILSPKESKIVQELMALRFLEYKTAAKVLLSRNDRDAAESVIEEYLSELNDLERKIRPKASIRGARIFIQGKIHIISSVISFCEQMGLENIAERLKPGNSGVKRNLN